jgi:hypothetical protein
MKQLPLTTLCIPCQIAIRCRDQSSFRMVPRPRILASSELLLAKRQWRHGIEYVEHHVWD